MKRIITVALLSIISLSAHAVRERVLGVQDKFGRNAGADNALLGSANRNYPAHLNGHGKIAGAEKLGVSKTIKIDPTSDEADNIAGAKLAGERDILLKNSKLGVSRSAAAEKVYVILYRGEKFTGLNMAAYRHKLHWLKSQQDFNQSLLIEDKNFLIDAAVRQ